MLLRCAALERGVKNLVGICHHIERRAGRAVDRLRGEFEFARHGRRQHRGDQIGHVDAAQPGREIPARPRRVSGLQVAAGG